MWQNQKDLWVSAILLFAVAFFVYVSWFPESNPLRNTFIPFAKELCLLFPLVLLIGPRPWPLKVCVVVLAIALGLTIYLGAPGPYPGVLAIGGFCYFLIYRLVWLQDPPLQKAEIYTVSSLFVIITVAMIVAVRVM